jgi:hypothetical protein
MASAASYRVLYASILISCFIHVAALRMPLHGKALAIPTQFHLSKVLLHDAVNGRLNSQHLRSSEKLSSKYISTNVKSSIDDNKAVIEPIILLDINRNQDLAWLPIETRFYTSSQLSKRPRVIEEVDLETAESRLLLATGKMVFSLLIDVKGKVHAVNIEQTDLPEIFTKAASNAFMQFKFEPGEIDGKPVGSILKIEITYDDAQLPSGENSDRR